MRRRKTAIFFLVTGICLSVLAIALNVGWILLSIREALVLVLGIIFFALIITGIILNTVFLVREIRRSEQHDTFLNSVTHELKTPITSIKIYLETLKNREVPEAKRQEFYDTMLADSDRLLKTVEQVLEAGRAKEPRRQYNVTELELNEVLGDAIDEVRTRFSLERGAIRFTPGSEDPIVLGDAEELKTAFTNLLENAVKYSDGEPRLSVRVKQAAIGKSATILFRDNGIGIPKSDLKRVFKRFHRVPNRAGGPGVKGTGLGLFIVKNIVERHGGKVSAESKGVGEGSTFFVQFPTI
ncbi:MAG: HAMP domain-containing histidine kinase [Blastocatellia bacterium]|nr:HAMP domain-containing histidine kinase [Blastocatellia bacterium]